MIAKLLRFIGLVALATAIVWLTREHLLPTPQVSHEPPPHYRSTPPPPPTTSDDLTAVKGIGPVYASKLAAMGISSFRSLSEMAPQTVADALGISTNAAADWIAQARARMT